MRYCTGVDDPVNRRQRDRKDIPSRTVKEVAGDIQKVARRKLMMIHAARETRDLKAPPGNEHEILKGKWNGWHSIRINDQWRICFQWDKGTATKVQIRDYH